MNFFQAQDKARYNTLLLLVLFVIAMGILIAGFYFLMLVIMNSTGGAQEEQVPLNLFVPELLLYCAGGVSLLVIGGGLYKSIELSGGGEAVAASMGGKLLLRSTRNAQEQQLLNIVEEMSIAAGAPMPGVYLIPDKGINAFAAGTTLNNAVIGVTAGALQAFNRDEMQGVIAHEFSHILNGDMRMSIRLISIIHGLLLLGLLGALCLRMSLFSSGRRDGRNPLPFIGLGLIVIGYAGVFFGSAIRAAISRQREFLADAAAVQFTRNPDGIGGALDKIGRASGLIEKPKAAEYAHMFFANGVASGFVNVFASHPPLPNRIKRILPNWDGETRIGSKDVAPPVDSPVETTKPSAGKSSQAVSALFGGAAIQAGAVVAGIGTINDDSLRLSAELCRQLPAQAEEALHDPYAARALIYAMLLDEKEETYRRAQLDYLQQNADTGVYELVCALWPDVQALSHRARLPLVQRALPVLRQLSAQQSRLFMDNLGAVIAADNAVDLFEWCVQAVVTRSLLQNFAGKSSASAPAREVGDGDYALSVLARAGQSDAAAAEAFAAARPMGRYKKEPFEPRQLFAVMQHLATLKPKEKSIFVSAAVAVVTHDGVVEEAEEALLRAYLMLLDCPLPAVLPAG